jgi:hypothetical protein
MNNAYSSVANFENELNAVTGIPINIFPTSPPLSTTFHFLLIFVIVVVNPVRIVVVFEPPAL